jgi:hypothetical protein
MALSGKNLARIGAAAGAATLAWNYVDDKYNISGDIEVSGRESGGCVSGGLLVSPPR